MTPMETAQLQLALRRNGLHEWSGGIFAGPAGARHAISDAMQIAAMRDDEPVGAAFAFRAADGKWHAACHLSSYSGCGYRDERNSSAAVVIAAIRHLQTRHRLRPLPPPALRQSETTNPHEHESRSGTVSLSAGSAVRRPA